MGDRGAQRGTGKNTGREGSRLELSGGEDDSPQQATSLSSSKAVASV